MSINRLTTGCSVIRTVEWISLFPMGLYKCSAVCPLEQSPQAGTGQAMKGFSWAVGLLLMGRHAKAQCNALDVRMWPCWQELREKLTPRLSVGSGRRVGFLCRGKSLGYCRKLQLIYRAQYLGFSPVLCWIYCNAQILARRFPLLWNSLEELKGMKGPGVFEYKQKKYPQTWGTTGQLSLFPFL